MTFFMGAPMLPSPVPTDQMANGAYMASAIVKSHKDYNHEN